MPKLFAHQKQALKRLRGSSVFAVFLDLGTGKTRVVLEDLREPNRLPAVLVTKAAIVEHIVNECLRWVPEIPVYNLHLRPRRSKWREVRAPKKAIYIDSYDGLTDWGTWSGEKRPRFDSLVFKKFKTIIFDESTMVKNHKTRRYKAAKVACEQIATRRIVSGLPAPEGVLDLWAQYDLLAPNRLPSPWWNFRNTYLRSIDPFGWKWEPYPGAAEEIEFKTKDITMRVRREDCLDLLPKMFELRVVQPSKATVELIKLVTKEWRTPYKDINEATERVGKLLQLTCGFHYGERSEGSPHAPVHEHKDDSKPRAIADILDEEVRPDERAVVWINFRAFCAGVQAFLRAVLRRPREVFPPKRLEAWRASKGGVLVTGYGMEAGVNFADVSSVAIYPCRPFRVESRVQSEDRQHRPPQHRSVRIFDIVSDTYHDRKYYEHLRQKVSLAQAIAAGTINVPGRV